MNEYDYDALDFLEGRCLQQDYTGEEQPPEYEELEFFVPTQLGAGPTPDDERRLRAAGYQQVTSTKWRRYL